MAPYHCDSREMTATPAALAPASGRRRPVVWWALLLASSMLAATVPASAALTTFPAGAYIINMGVVPQTVSNGLRPYGLVYDIVTNSRIPLYWSINPAKSKDGVDFVADGISFSGGSFIVPAEFVINSVVTSINNWKSQGVVVYGPTTSSFTAPVYNTVTYFPRTLIDTANEALIQPFYDAAGIPTTSYKVGLPSDLTHCIDLYSLPHSDPAWSTHHYLIDYIRAGGYFFSGCHGVSAFENLINPATGQYECAFLSDPRLTLFGDHKEGSPPYNYRDDAHPIMQFMSTLDGATTDGSEQIFMPALGGQWRPTTTLAVWDPTQFDVLSGKSAGPAAALVYGRAYGNSSCGMALYIGGHDLSGSTTADVAAQRAYLNFLLLSGIDRRPGLAITVPAQIVGGTTAPVIAIASGGTGDYTYQWTSLDGGTFSNSAAATTGFTAPNVGTPTLMVIRCFLTDGPCRRQNFAADTVLVLPAAHVTGTVYEDLNHNQKLDSMETGTGVTGMYAKLLPAACGAAVRAVAVDPTSGAYDFAYINNGDY
ncbi:MAG: hypothetical protein ABFE07_26850, partial [Armatimonadia bacterium]